MCKVSVIIPVYKVEKWLDQCVASVVDQTYKDIEIILVDDGSPDHCPRMCDEWAERDARIRVIHKDNGGLSDARNAGLDAANGEWLMFVDSDDFVHPEMVARSLETAHRTQAEMVAFSYERVDKEGNSLCQESADIGEHTYAGDELLRAFVKYGTGFMVSWNKLYRKAIWDTLRYPLGRFHEDEFVIIDVLERTRRATVTDAVFYYYRQRPESIMAMKSKKKEYDKLEALELRCMKLSSEPELHQHSLNLFLEHLIRMYFIADHNGQRRILKRFREKIKLSPIYNSWNMNAKFALFFISPRLYFAVNEVRKICMRMKRK